MAVADAPRTATRAWLAVALAVLTAALYLPALDHAWLNYDDDVYITQNPDLLRGLGPDGVVWAFTSFHGANWFPLTRLSWMLDYEIHGLAPAGFHATGLALHALCAALLFLALCRLSGKLARSAFVAAVFAVHPLHVESVAWAAARKDPLSAVFFALALWLYARRARAGLALRGHLLLLACMALGLMAKPILVTLPLVLLLLDEWPLGRLRREGSPERWDPARVRRAVVEKLPLLALAAAFGGVVLLAQSRGGTVVGLERLPLDDRAANALLAAVGYLGKAFWPAGLSVFYPHPGAAWSGWRVAAAAGLLVGITLFALRAAPRHPYLAVGWLWYLVTLAPVIGLVQVGSQGMADRYTYLPLIGLSIAVAWGVPDLLGAGRARRAALAVAGTAAVAALALTASLQLRHWRDSEALFAHALRVDPDNHVAHTHLGGALLERGQTQAAIDHYLEAVRLRPDAVRVANNLAWLLATSDDESVRNPYLAVQLARRAVQLSGARDPALVDTLAAAYASEGRFPEAARTAERAAALAEQAGELELAGEIRRRAALYRSRRAYREPPAPARAPGVGL